MRATRRRQQSVPENVESMRNQERSKPPHDLVQVLMEDMSENMTNPDILVPLSSRIEMMQEQIRTKSVILMGPGHSGKSSTIYWVMRHKHKSQHYIWIDCAFWQSEHPFIVYLLDEISNRLNIILKKSIVVKGEISFKDLNKEIKKANRELTIVLKNPEKLRDHNRPVLLYNIFEWMNVSQTNQNLNFIILTREIRFIDKLDKRIKSRMNIPILYLARPRADKIIQILVKRVERSIRRFPKKEELGLKLKKAIEQKDLQKLINSQNQAKAQPISYYLKIMQLILAIGVQSEQKLSLITQKQLTELVYEGFQSYSMYIVDHRNIAKTFFSECYIPEIILMGLYRARFLRQKEGSYNAPITLGELMNDYNQKKRVITLDEGGNSFLYSQLVMQNALKNLLDWNFIGFAHANQKLSLINREINSRYGPEDIEYLYQELEGMPAIVKAIYDDSV